MTPRMILPLRASSGSLGTTRRCLPAHARPRERWCGPLLLDPQCRHRARNRGRFGGALKLRWDLCPLVAVLKETFVVEREHVGRRVLAQSVALAPFLVQYDAHALLPFSCLEADRQHLEGPIRVVDHANRLLSDHAPSDIARERTETHHGTAHAKALVP